MLNQKLLLNRFLLSCLLKVDREVEWFITTQQRVVLRAVSSWARISKFRAVFHNYRQKTRTSLFLGTKNDKSVDLYRHIRTWNCVATTLGHQKLYTVTHSWRWISTLAGIMHLTTLAVHLEGLELSSVQIERMRSDIYMPTERHGKETRG